jgi:hypothetical protein
MNKIKMSWPKISTVIHPYQTLRINTGWRMEKIPNNTLVTAIPHTAMI